MLQSARQIDGNSRFPNASLAASDSDNPTNPGYFILLCPGTLCARGGLCALVLYFHINLINSCQSANYAFTLSFDLLRDLGTATGQLRGETDCAIVYRYLF